MSSSAAPAAPAGPAAPAIRPIIYLGMDVHKESITVAVLPEGAKTPTRLDRLSNDLPKLKKWIERVARDGEIQACYEASGAGYLLHRALQEWGYACEVIAPSLIPKRSGVHRQHDKREAADLARLSGTALSCGRARRGAHPERGRRAGARCHVVRCRETFQREILTSRHYILKFLARRGVVFLSRGHQLVYAAPPVAAASDDRRLAPRCRRSARVPRVPRAAAVHAAATRGAGSSDRATGAPAFTRADGAPTPMLQCFRGISLHSAMGTSHGDRRLAALRTSQTASVLPRPRLARGLERRPAATRLDHQGGQQPLPARPGPSRLELSPSTADER